MNMLKAYPISVAEESAINALGGFEQVVGMVDGILREHNIKRSLFSKRERNQIRRGRDFKKKRIEFHFDTGKSLRSNIDDLLRQAEELQADGGGTAYVGAMLQHLVGAKLDLVLGKGKIEHHGFSVADSPTARKGDFLVESVAIHVTTNPSEALVRKCAANFQAGLKPLIVTLGDGVNGAAFLLKNSELSDRVDVLDAAQFLTANIYEHSFFKASTYKVTLSNLLSRYNEIVLQCETDPVLQIDLKKAG
jgi:hypothetical protein